MNLLEYLGSGLLLYVFYQFLINFLKAFYPIKDLTKRYGADTWAVITGGSDGIGKGFAFVLAKYGFNICIIARNPQKLAKVKEEIEKELPNIKVKWIKADFTKSFEPDFFEEIYKELQSLDISILVNNVGVIYSNYFEKTTEETLRKSLAVNVMPQVFMTHKLINKLLERKHHKSAIINISSILGAYPTPYEAMYSSGKVFNDFFSRSLFHEFREKIDVLSLRPFYVSTLMTFERKAEYDCITPKECAEGCLRSLGKWDQTWGHYKHSLQGFIYDLTPGWVVTWFLRRMGPSIIKYREIQDKKFIRE